jgi:hypothetical protein
VREKGRVARRRRADCGSIKASTRDFELLAFVGEQYAVTFAAASEADGSQGGNGEVVA